MKHLRAKLLRLGIIKPMPRPHRTPDQAREAKRRSDREHKRRVRHAAAIAAGREPGKPGRPWTSRNTPRG
jgi:hypothetical protein